EAFLEELGRRIGRPAAGISRAAREILLGYAWPGNVRELRNVLERATILCDGGLITAEHLPIELAKREEASSAAAGAAEVPAGVGGRAERGGGPDREGPEQPPQHPRPRRAPARHPPRAALPPLAEARPRGARPRRGLKAPASGRRGDALGGQVLRQPLEA